MKTYILCIGGSGARILRAIIHNCAAGIIREKEIKIALIDADIENADWERLQKEHECYQHMHKIMKRENKSPRQGHKTIMIENIPHCFETNIDLISNEQIISPVNYPRNKSLEESVNGDKNLQRMMGWFYSEDEMEEDLKKGFFARPNIGCIFFSYFENVIFNQLLDDIMNELNKNEQINLMLAGSIFGGTGASGIPTIMKLIHQRIKDTACTEGYGALENKAYENLNISAIFLTPYFKVEKKSSQKNELIDVNNFMKATKNALKYYEAGGYFQNNSVTKTKGFQSLYIVNKETPDLVNFYSAGGSEQNNKPHIAEEYAALAVRHFLENMKNKNNSIPIVNTKIFTSEVEDDINWDSLPAEPGIVQEEFGKLSWFSTIFHTCIYQFAISQNNDSKKNKDVPQWYKVYLKKNTGSVSNDDLILINKYCQYYIEWIYKLQVNLKVNTDTLEDTYNLNMSLFGHILAKIYQIISTSENIASSEIENEIDEIKRNFNQLIEGGKAVGFFAKKCFLIISRLNIIAGLEKGTGFNIIANDLYRIIENKGEL